MVTQQEGWVGGGGGTEGKSRASNRNRPGGLIVLCVAHTLNPPSEGLGGLRWTDPLPHSKVDRSVHTCACIRTGLWPPCENAPGPSVPMPPVRGPLGAAGVSAGGLVSHQPTQGRSQRSAGGSAIRHSSASWGVTCDSAPDSQCQMWAGVKSQSKPVNRERPEPRTVMLRFSKRRSHPLVPW